jgi:hypothetical protein
MKSPSIGAQPHTAVFVTSTAASAATLAKFGLIAITPDNASTFQPLLSACRAVIPTFEGAVGGEDWAEQVARALHGVAAEIRIAVLPNPTSSGTTVNPDSARALGEWMHSEPAAAAALLRAADEARPWRPARADSLAEMMAPFVVPDGYRVTRAGVAVEKAARRAVRGDEAAAPTWTPVTVAPLWIAARYEDPQGGDAAVQLRMRVGGRTISQVVPLEMISTSAQIPKLSTFGFVGFDTPSATGIVTYLRHALRANLATIPVVRTVQRLGSTHDVVDRSLIEFTFGGARYLRDGSTEPVELSPSASAKHERFVAFRSHGTPEGWAKLLHELRAGRYWMILTGIYAAVGSLLNRPLHRDPFVVQYAGESSCGKTTALRLVQTVTCAPVGVHSMRTTTNALESIFAMHNDLPIFLDELKSYAQERHGDQDRALADLCYMVSQGEGKDRMTKSITQRATFTWSANALLTGEMDVSDASVDAGGKVRCIVLWGSPFHERSAAAAAAQERLLGIARAHYGWAVPLVAQHLLALTSSGWDDLRRRHEWATRHYATACTPERIDGAAAKRLAEMFGLMEVAGDLLASVFPSAFVDEEGGRDEYPSTRQVLETAWAAQLTRMQAVLRVERSVDAVREFYATRLQDFEGATVSYDAPRATKTVGRVLTVDGMRQLAILSGELDAYLKQRGFRIDTESKHWRDAGLTVGDAAGNTTKKVRVVGVPTRCVVFDLNKLEALGDPAPGVEQPDVDWSDVERPAWETAGAVALASGAEQTISHAAATLTLFGDAGGEKDDLIDELPF